MRSTHAICICNLRLSELRLSELHHSQEYWPTRFLSVDALKILLLELRQLLELSPPLELALALEFKRHAIGRQNHFRIHTLADRIDVDRIIRSFNRIDMCQ